ncbi:MAG: formate dehydrogenase accessory protein FdhE [Deltaproteobacteria bacterium]|uniref:Formate dehydrogenase accessory protein FdhE n=1 Tax=Candidatus Zymogenus saltonus TaxID=2844893 RepID=A0A9D8PJQ7_9DELT|nr:formate dehydrogenase accessory protein FdhE [Candidatus Zymogenus saltonus]
MNREERRAIEKSKEKHPEIVEVLDLFLKLSELSCDTIPVNGKSISWDKLKEGFPAIDKRTLPKDLGTLFKRFKNIVEILLTRNSDFASAVNALFEREELFRELLEGVLMGQYDFPKDFSHLRPVILFAAGETLLPLINGVKLADPPKKALDSWGKSYCPICGAPPNISAIEGEENRLFLYCGRCSQSWNFPRLVCVHCGEEDQKKLQYFFAKNDEIHRVYVCDSCKHYIKSVDKREKTVVFPQLEDLTTMGLDIVAKKEGYKRESVDFVGLILTDYEVKKGD